MLKLSSPPLKRLLQLAPQDVTHVQSFWQKTCSFALLHSEAKSETSPLLHAASKQFWYD